MRRASKSLLFLLPALVFGQAHAGNVELGLVAEPDLDIGGAEIVLSSDDATIATDADGAGATFTIIDPLVASAQATVSIDNLPSGVAPFTMLVNLPFFMTKSNDARVVAALVKDKLEGETVQGITRSASQQAGSLNSLVLLNQRARIARVKLLAQPRPLNADDGKMALIFVQTAKELGINFFVEPDDEMKDAVLLLKTILAGSPAELDRTMPIALDRTNAQLAINEFQTIALTQTSKLVAEVARRVQSPRAELRAEGCAMADAMNDRLSGLSEEDRPMIDPTWRRTTINLTHVLMCRSREIAWRQGHQPEDADARVESARIALDQMKTSIGWYEGVDGADQGVLRNAQARFDEVSGRVDVITLTR
jgi:hypothetical protein